MERPRPILAPSALDAADLPHCDKELRSGAWKDHDAGGEHLKLRANRSLAALAGESDRPCRALLNRAALKACVYTKDTPNPPGGEIVRDKAGNPTGMLVARPNATILYVGLLTN